jgi:hypothetical protein
MDLIVAAAILTAEKHRHDSEVVKAGARLNHLKHSDYMSTFDLFLNELKKRTAEKA